MQDSYFPLDFFRRNQTLKSYFEDSVDNDKKAKEDKEIRLIAVDFTFANAINLLRENKTIIQCISGCWHGNKFIKHLDYIEGYSASNNLKAVKRVKEIFLNYEADFIVFDLRNGGEVLYDEFAKLGFTVLERNYFGTVSESKYEDLRGRCFSPDSIPCIIPIIGSGELNHSVWIELKKQLEIDNCKFLVNESEKAEEMRCDEKQYNLTSDEWVKILSPYIESEFMIFEAISLQQEWKNNRIKLIEPRHGSKYSILTFAYGNYILTRIEQKLSNKDF